MIFEQVARDCKYLSTTVKFEIGTESFSLTGNSLMDPGYTSLLTWQALGANDSLPNLKGGDSVAIHEVEGNWGRNNENLSFGTLYRASGWFDEFVIFSLQAKLLECMTQPPDYLTESELITLMEKHGIGTDASIPVHINNIGTRNYVTVVSGRKLVPTSLGIVLVHGYQKVLFAFEDSRWPID